MQAVLRSPSIALVAAGLLFATIASAHLHRPIAEQPPRLRAAMDASGSLSGAESDRRAATISRRSVLLGGRLPWVPAPIFHMFNVFPFESFDPKTGDYLLYAKVAPRARRGGAVR
jgi:hypothetical protein